MSAVEAMACVAELAIAVALRAANAAGVA